MVGTRFVTFPKCHHDITRIHLLVACIPKIELQCGSQDDRGIWIPRGYGPHDQAVDLEEGRPEGQLALTRALIAWHRDTPAFHSDQLTALSSPDDLLVFERGTGDEAVLCVFNLSNAPVTYELPARWAEATLMIEGGEVEPTTGAVRRYAPWAWQWVTSQS